MKQILLLLLLGAGCLNANGQGSFTAADTMSVGVVKTGTVNGIIGQHYYKTALPGMGVFRLITYTGNTGSASGIVQYRVFWKNQNTVNYYDVYRSPFASGADTFLVGALQADSLFILVDNVWNGQPINYSVQYDLISQLPNDESSASNDTRPTAEVLPINTTRNGHIAFATPNGSDLDDYYKIVFPRNGTFRLHVSGTSLVAGGSVLPRIHVANSYGAVLTLFRASGGGGGYYHIGNATVPAYTTVLDTMSVYGRAEDTMYIWVEGYNWTAAYSLKWTVVDTAVNNEPGPNETIAQAPLIAEGTTINGDISYSGAGPDLNDYYRIVLAKDATITLYTSSMNTYDRQANPAPVIYVRNKNTIALPVQNNAGIMSSQLNIANNGSVPFLGSVIDTMHVFGRAKDTFYINVYNYHSGQGVAYAAHYTLRYKLTDTSVYNEQEPNDTRPTAQHITPADTVRGKVSYVNGYDVTDIDDYFRIVKPLRGSIRLYITGRNTWGWTVGYAGAPVVNVYDKFGTPFPIRSATGAYAGSMRVRNNASLPYGASVTDTMLIECIATDTIYVQVSNYINFQYGGVSSDYKLRYEYLPVTKSGLEYARTGNEFGFINQAANANAYLWLLGNGQQYTSYYPPLTTYGPGNYDVKLVAINTTCSYRDTALVNFTVAGLEYYTPKRAGKGGDAIIQIYGGALDTNTVITLSRGTTILTPRAKYINGRLNHLTADFDLHFADTGFYDVHIQVPGQAAATFTNGFYIEGLQYPYAWSQVVGPGRMRTNVDNRYTLLVGNRGNVTANGVVVAMVWPKNVTVTWKASVWRPDYNKNDTLVSDTTTYVFPNTIYKYIYDSTNTTTAIDSFEGRPYDGYMRYIQLAHVPARGTIEIPFTARASITSNNRFITYTHHPNFLGSCPTGNYEDYGNDMAAELIDAADMLADKTKMPVVQAFTKTAKIGQKHMQSAATYVGKEFWAWYDGYETDHDANVNDWLNETDANNEYAIQTLIQELASATLSAGVAKAGALNQRIQFANKLIANNPKLSAKGFDRAMDIINKSGKGLGGINYDRLKLLKSIFDNTKNAADLSEKLLKLQELANDCPELQEQIKELEDMLNQELDHQDPQSTDVDTRTSFDPNGIYGPGGIDTVHFINTIKTQPFLIAFENVDTAGADAQEVVVRDTVDKTRFDIATLEFGDVVVANQLFRVPAGRRQFVVQHRLNNMAGMLLRVIANVDTAAGVVTWHFSSIDSATMAKPVFNGFLRPNILKPEGEGTVRYTISPRAGLTDGMMLQSKATIVFDDNVPMSTGVWTNTLDLAPPSSIISSGTQRDDTVVVLHFSGSDAASGIGNYAVYFSTNNGPWHTLGRSSTDSMVFNGQYDSSYRFYVKAVDRVGNKETKNPIAEYSITMPVGVEGQSLIARGTSLSLYPNPASDEVNVRISVAGSQNVKLLLRDIAGRLIGVVYEGSVTGSALRTFDISHVQSGIYMVQLQTDAGVNNVGKLTVTH